MSVVERDIIPLDDAFNSAAEGQEIYALALQSDGKILVAGDIRILDGALRRNIARLNPDGTLDSVFNP